MRNKLLWALVASTAICSSTVLFASEPEKSTPQPVLKPENLGVPVPPKAPGTNGPNRSPDHAAKAEISNRSPELTERVALPLIPVTSRSMSESLGVMVAGLDPVPLKPTINPHPDVFFRDVLPEAMRLGDYDREHFQEDLASLRTAFGKTRSGTVSNFVARMKMAEFYLAHLMVPEGLSFLDGIPVEALTEEERLYYSAVRSGLLVAGGRRSSRDFIPGNREYYKWDDFAFWTAIDAINRRDFEGAGEYVGKAFGAISRYPYPYQKEMLPLLLEAALETGQWKLAQRIAVRFDDYPALRRESAYQFLMGLAAKNAGEMLAAFDAFLLAARGSDVYAQRARIEMIDIGLATYAMPLEDAKVFLESSRSSWRGDQYEIEVLKRLADVDRSLSNISDAIATMGILISSFPDSPEAETARLDADSLLEKYYEMGASGEVTLTDFVSGHRNISRYYRFHPGFGRYHQGFAEKLVGLGATSKGAKEYFELSEHLQIALEQGLWDLTADEVFSVKLKAAQAYAKGAQYEAAAKILAGVEMFEDPAMNNELQRVKAEVFGEVRDADAVLGTVEGLHDLEHMRLVAEAYGAKGDWKSAKQTLLSAKEEYGDDLTTEDAINLLLAAHRDGDTEVVMRISGMFPEIVESREWQNIARGLRYDPAPIVPLKADNVASRLQKAESALSDIDAADGL